MTTPTRAPCWPNDPGYLDRSTEIELPAERFTKAFWITDILDLEGKINDAIIGTDELFQVRFRVELRGRLWRCVTGDWLFDVGFKAIGPGAGFYLSALLPGNPGLSVKGWRGCDTLCIDQTVTVPPGTIQLQGDTEVYEVAATCELRCCDDHIAFTSYAALEEYEFFQGS
jgi:hypothetical protein